MAYFPMFIQMEHKVCLIVGEDDHALRKSQIMEEFGAKVKVVGPASFEESLLDDSDIVILSTSNKEWNHKIAQICKQRNLPINVVDQPEDCTFIFPSYLKQGDVVAAFSSGGKSPLLTQYLKREMEPILTEEVGELNEELGKIRSSQTVNERKAYFEEAIKNLQKEK